MDGRSSDSLLSVEHHHDSKFSAGVATAPKATPVLDFGA